MRNVRSLMRRVQKLEQARLPPYAWLDEFEAEVRAGVETHKLDRIDMLGEDGMGGVLGALRRWERDGLPLRG